MYTSCIRIETDLKYSISTGKILEDEKKGIACDL
jgi:hypothetical protein